MDALEFARKKHEGQKDKAGNPFYLHPKWVGDHLTDPVEKIVGYLHDTIEDTNTTSSEILENFGCIVRDAVMALTKKENENYLDFIERVQQNRVAVSVKIMDIRHNMDLSRVPNEPTESDYFRIRNKYIPAYCMLTGHHLTLSEQFQNGLNDFELKHMLWNIYQTRWKEDRINRNIRYILNGDSTAVSDELKEYVEEVLK